MALIMRSSTGLNLLLHTSRSTTRSVLRRNIYNPPLRSQPLRANRQTSAPHLSLEDFRELNVIRQQDTFEGLHKGSSHTNPVPASPEETWLQMHLRHDPLAVPSDKFSGRSVSVMGLDVGGAWRRLKSIIRQNNIRNELILTERHEKKGVRRRRLCSTRWRRRFANEVRKKVKLVNQIMRQARMWNTAKR